MDRRLLIISFYFFSYFSLPNGEAIMIMIFQKRVSLHIISSICSVFPCLVCALIYKYLSIYRIYMYTINKRKSNNIIIQFICLAKRKTSENEKINLGILEKGQRCFICQSIRQIVPFMTIIRMWPIQKFHRCKINMKVIVIQHQE